MVTKAELLQRLPAYQASSKLIERNQDVQDIIGEILNAHELFKKDYGTISESFNTGNLATIARGLWNFCKKNIRYQIEPEEKQTTKSPAGILVNADSIGGDCKHYSLFIGGVLDAIARKSRKPINWNYRFSSYKAFDKTPQHVFVVVKLNGGREIWIDPVLESFDEKKSYTYAIDKKPKNNSMALYRVSGISLQGINEMQQIGLATQGNIFKKAGKAINKGFNAVKKAVVKVSAAVPRNAFLALVALNVRGMATALNNKLSNPTQKAKLFSTWQKVGGSTNALESTIKSGAKKKRIMGIEGVEVYDNTVGAVSLAAILASAAPIIAALGQFLKGGAPETAQTVEESISLVKDNLQVAVNNNPVPIVPPTITQVTQEPSNVQVAPVQPYQVQQAMQQPAAQYYPQQSQPYAQTQYSEQQEESGQANQQQVIEQPAGDSLQSFLTPKNLMIAGGAGLALYFLSKRR